MAATDSNPDDNPPAGENRPPSSVPPTSVPTGSEKPELETFPFGKSDTWDDGVTLTVGKPKKFEPSEYAVVDKAKRYVKFAVTVVNKSDRHIDLGLTYISVQSSNEGTPSLRLPERSQRTSRY
jgi:hypothetical protein